MDVMLIIQLLFTIYLPTGQNEAAFTFDYLSLLTVSSAIASIGLATNSVVVIVASSK